MGTPPKTKRKYNLHYRVRKQGFIIRTKEHTIIVKHDKQETLTKQIKALANEYNYVIQTSII